MRLLGHMLRSFIQGFHMENMTNMTMFHMLFTPPSFISWHFCLVTFSTISWTSIILVFEYITVHVIVERRRQREVSLFSFLLLSASVTRHCGPRRTSSARTNEPPSWMSHAHCKQQNACLTPVVCTVHFLSQELSATLALLTAVISKLVVSPTGDLQALQLFPFPFSSVVFLFLSLASSLTLPTRV